MKRGKVPTFLSQWTLRHRPEIQAVLAFLLVLLLSVTWALPAGTQYAVVVGISTYRDLPEQAWLDFAHSDARAYADLLKSRYVGVPPENVTTLLNEEATTVKLKTALGELLKKSTEEDIVYIYIASHGTVDIDLNEAFFVTYDTNPENLYGTAYRMSEFQYITNQVKAKHLIVISDACKSGGIGADITGSRRDIGQDEVVVNQYFRDILEENLGVGESQFIYAAAGARESSLEDDNLGGGVFTKYLIQALQGAADSNQDGNVTAAETHDYVFNNVRQYTKGHQNPMIINAAQYEGHLVLAVTEPGAEAGLLLDPDPPTDTRDLLMTSPPAISQSLAGTPSSPTAAQPSSAVAAGFGSLFVESPLEGVEISINGNRTGILQGQPLLITLPAGQYRLTATKADHETVEEPISVQPNQQLNRMIQLRPLFDPEFKELENKFLDARGIYWDEDPEQAEQLFREVFDTLTEWGQRRGLNREEDQYLVDSFIHYTNLQMAKDTGVKTLESWIEQFFKVHILLPGADQMNEPEKYRQVVRDHAVEFIVDSKLAEARLSIDDLPEQRIQGQEHFFIKPGLHRIRISKENYRPFETAIDFRPDVQYSPLIYEGNLQRLHFLALSEHPLTASLNRSLEVEARPLEQLLPGLNPKIRQVVEERVSASGLNASRLSAVYFDQINPNTNRLVFDFSRPGFEQQTHEVALSSDVMDRIHSLDGYLVMEQVVRLEPMIGHLKIISDPPGADVLLNLQEIGTTPFEGDVPVGDYEIKVKHGTAGTYLERLTVDRNQSYAIEAKLKPVLVYVGVLPTQEVGPEKLADLNEELSKETQARLASYLLETQPAARYEFWDQFLEMMTDGIDEAEMEGAMRHLDVISERFDSQLILFGAFRTLNEYLANRLSLFLINASNPRPNVWEINSRTFTELDHVMDLINYAPQLEERFFRNWIGIKVLDTQVPEHELVVIDVYAGSPAEMAGLTKGDVIQSVDGESVDALDLYESINRKKPGDRIALATQQGTSQVTIQQTPAVVSSTSFLNNATLSALKVALERYPKDSLKHQLALLHIAISHMNFENWHLAIEHLNSLDQTQIHKGYVAYLLGRCFEALEEEEQAVVYYQQAEEAGGGVLGFEYADSGSQLAQWRLRALR